VVISPAASLIDAPGTSERAWRGWPGLSRLPAADITGWRSAVVIAAHPDDEVLGAGGIMALLAPAGARLRLVAVTDGEASHPGGTDPAGLAACRTAETAAALRALGAEAVETIRLRFPDTGLAARVTALTRLLAELTAGFDACLAPWLADAHADHEAAGRSAGRASRRTLYYPVWMWHWARPGDPRVPWRQASRVPLTPAVAARKHAAIRCFASQLEPRPGGGAPVLPPGVVEHFTRDHEVLIRPGVS
jgi:LmbE family N-acetylglucosaminyl deacetylase